MRGALVLAALAAAAVADDPLALAHELARGDAAAARAAIPEMIALGRGGPAARFAARDALAVAGPPAVAKLIEGAAGDPGLSLLLEGVSRDLGAGVVVAALPALGSKDPKVRAVAALALGAAGPGGEACVKQLIEALYDADAHVRREAALALGGIGRGAHDSVPALIHLANDPERGTQGVALVALGMILRDAAERERAAPGPPPELAGAIGRGVRWLVAQQETDGSWAVPLAADAGAPALARARARVAAGATLAMIESGTAGAHAAPLRSAIRVLVAADTDGAREDADPVVWALCAAARVLREPECRAAAGRALAVLATTEELPGPAGPHALSILEAGFAGLIPDPLLREMDIHDADAVSTVLIRLAAGKDPDSEEMRQLVESCGSKPGVDPEGWAWAARARWYGGAKSDALREAALRRQREDGSWDAAADPLGAVHTTAWMLVCLETSAGLSRPLSLPLPDAPQFKAAVATLRIARQSKDAGIRTCAEQALAGFAVR
jgi:hypothetical protein